MPKKSVRIGLRLVPEDSLLVARIAQWAHCTPEQVFAAAIQFFAHLLESRALDCRELVIRHMTLRQQFTLVLPRIHSRKFEPMDDTEPDSTHQFFLPANAAAHTDRLIGKGFAANRQSLIRVALASYHLILEKERDGWEIFWKTPGKKLRRPQSVGRAACYLL
ncbi:MAG: hypothetical protein Q8P82_01710 [bacterium]|nr:hypothetical protein [bacterium]